MRIDIRKGLPLCATLALLACGVETEEPVTPSADGDHAYVLDGDVPAGVDLEDALSRVPPGGFGIVGDPGTGEIATLVSSSSPLARVASSEFSVAVAASCPDCGDPTCASMDRTIDVTLSHDSGIDGETYSVLPSSSTNFSAPTTTPASWGANVGDTIGLSTTGTLSTCSTFGYFFDVVGPDPVVENILFSEYLEGSTGTNKFVEITNNGTVGFDLTGCTVKTYFNGNSAPGGTVNLTGTLAVGDVFLICSTGFTFTPGGSCDVTTGSMNFNGDDAVELACGATVYDVIGQIGLDPGTEWGGSPGTADDSLKRSCGVTNGDSDGSDAFDPASEWTSQGLNNAANLGLPNVCP